MTKTIYPISRVIRKYISFFIHLYLAYGAGLVDRSMAKLRQNHTRSSTKSTFGGLFLRVALMIAAFVILFVLGYPYLTQEGSSAKVTLSSEDQKKAKEINSDRLALIPEGNLAEVVRHTYYTLGYDEASEHATWVTYELNKSELQIPNVPRTNWFEEDPLVTTKSAHHRDFSGSGYSRGHLAPAGDMAFSEEAMKASFYMSNMSPQLNQFNGGIWRELEETTREWAYASDQLLVATGPIFDGVTKTIGTTSKIRVPTAYYKILADIVSRPPKGIAFVIPHEVTDRPLTDFVVTIDEVEERLGLDFFDAYYVPGSEHDIEAKIDLDLWPFNQKKYQDRIQIWTKEKQ